MSTHLSRTTILVGFDAQGVGVTGQPRASIPITTVNNTVGPGAETTSQLQSLYVPSEVTVSPLGGAVISTSTTWIPTLLEVPLVTFPLVVTTTVVASHPSAASGSSATASYTSAASGSSAPASSLNPSNSSISTAPASTSSAHHHSKPTSGSKYTSSDLAGAAVGCAIGGALIAGLLVWLFMSFRRKKQRPRGGFAEHQQSTSNANLEKSLPTAPSLGGAAAAGWEQHLPQSESDSTMRSSVKALFDQIELHVENFYRNAAVSISPEMQRELMKVDSSYLPDSVAGLLSQTRTPTMLIKHCLAYLIISRITADSDAPASFLPVDFVALPRAIGGTRANKDKPAFAQALSRWRVLSSYLRPRAKDDRAYLSARDANIAATADLFCLAFAPWAINPNDLEARRQHLINIMKSAADTGILIFSQPSRFAYRWAVPSDRDRKGLNRIVVLPGFAKVSDERARDLPGQGQELVSPVLGTL